jgi:hypothetical protein
MTRNSIKMTAVATTIPIIWQIRTDSVVDQPVVLAQMVVATLRTIINAMMPRTPTRIRFIIPLDIILSFNSYCQTDRYKNKHKNTPLTIYFRMQLSLPRIT